MVADNDLYYNAETDVSEVLHSDYDTTTTNILIYVDGKPNSLLGHPALYKVQGGELVTLKKYAATNSTYATTLQQVLLDSRQWSRSQHYGLILWSHGTGWLPPNSYDNIPSLSLTPRLGMVKSFGRQNKQEMDIVEMAQNIPYPLEFILFDACLMGGIEVCYELADKTQYIMASPTDILAYGYPYDRIIPVLSSPEIDYRQLGEAYMSFYNEKTGILRAASISIVKTAMIETLADSLISALSRNQISFTDFKTIDNANIQRYDELKTPVFYDFSDVYRSLLNDTEFKQIQYTLNKAVLYKQNTPLFLNLSIDSFSGLSTFIPNENEALSTYYRRLKWYQEIFLTKLDG